MQQISRADQIENTDIRELYTYWQSKRVGGALPKRADIDPAEFLHLMPNLLLADIERDPFRVRYRLVGTKVVQMTGYEFTGKYLDEFAFPEDQEAFLRCYEAVCKSKMPVSTRLKWHHASDKSEEYDLCFLPLSDDGDVVNMVLAIESYENLKRAYSRRAGPTMLPGGGRSTE